MKKFVIIYLMLFIAGVGCKKTDIDGGGLCGCSPATAPEFNLVIKNSSGDDLLNEKITGAYTKNKIELFKKDADGNKIPLYFDIKPPFSNTIQTFKYYSLYTPNLTFSSNNNTIYLRLDTLVYEVTVHLNTDKYRVDKLLVENKELEKDNGDIAKYRSVFYLTK